MKVQDLITDAAIEIVFKGTDFGNISPREVIEDSLLKIKQGYHIGRTAKCCLYELGLVTYDSSRNKYDIALLGQTYLDLLNQDSE